MSAAPFRRVLTTVSATSATAALTLIVSAPPALARTDFASAYGIHVSAVGSLRVGPAPTAVSDGDPSSADDTGIRVDPEELAGGKTSVSLRDVHVDAARDPATHALSAQASAGKSEITLVGPAKENAPSTEGVGASVAHNAVLAIRYEDKAGDEADTAVRELMAENASEVKLNFAAVVAQCDTGRGGEPSGGIDIENGRVGVGGVEEFLASEPLPNTVVTVPGVDGVSLVLNEQNTAPDGTLTINAIHLRVESYSIVSGPTVQLQDAIIGSVSCGAVTQPLLPVTGTQAVWWTASGVIAVCAALGYAYFTLGRRRLVPA